MLNVMVYTAVPKRAARIPRLTRSPLPLLGTRPLQAILKNRIDAAPAGPDDQAREKAINQLWGEARGPSGYTAVSRLRTPEGYTLTAKMALRIASKICAGEVTPGFQTPATAYGKDLILELPGAERMDA